MKKAVILASCTTPHCSGLEAAPGVEVEVASCTMCCIKCVARLRSISHELLSSSQKKKFNALVHLLCKVMIECTFETVCLVPGAAGHSIRLAICIC
jgi:hypothetical protein